MKLIKGMFNKHCKFYFYETLMKPGFNITGEIVTQVLMTQFALFQVGGNMFQTCLKYVRVWAFYKYIDQYAYSKTIAVLL